MNMMTYQGLQSADEDVRLQTLLDREIPTTPDEITLFVSMLSDKSWRVRKAVVRLLAQVEAKVVVPFLIKALSARNPGIQNVRFHNSAIECLIAIGQPAIPALTTALQDEDKNVRIAAANVLGAIRHHDACDALINALHDPNVNVRYAAVEALSKIPSQKSILPLTTILEEDEEWLKLPAISALGHIGDYRATPYLIKTAEHPLYLQTVVEALGHIGDERGIPCIMAALHSSDKEIRKSATMAMEQMAHKLDKFHAIINHPITYPHTFRVACTEQIMLSLIDLLDEKDFSLVVAAIKLLGWSGRQEAAYALLEKLDYEQLQETVLSALIRIKADAIVPLAHAYTTSRSLEHKLLLIDCLREIGGVPVLDLLLRYLEKSDEELLTYSILKTFTLHPFFSLIEAKRTNALDEFHQIRERIKHYLDANHPLVRAEAIYLWGQMLGSEALDEILSATKDIDPTVRVNAIKLLKGFIQETPELLQHLTIFLSDDHPNIRKQATIALGCVSAPEVLPALLLVLDDSHAAVRRAAVTGIRTYLRHNRQPQAYQQVLDKLAAVLEHRCRRYEDGLLKIEICQTLQHIHLSQSKELVLELVHDVDFDVRKAAILALGRFTMYSDSLAPILLTFLDDPHWSVREATVIALGNLKVPQIEDSLFPLLQDPDLTVRKALFLTLGRLESIRSIPILVEHLGHDELDAAAYQGLTALVDRYHDQIAAHRSDENPKVHLLLNHLLTKHTMSPV